MRISSLNLAKRWRVFFEAGLSRFYYRGSTTSDRDSAIRLSKLSNSTKAHKLTAVPNTLLRESVLRYLSYLRKTPTSTEPLGRKTARAEVLANTTFAVTPHLLVSLTAVPAERLTYSRLIVSKRTSSLSRSPPVPAEMFRTTFL